MLVHSPTHYTARLLALRNNNSSKWVNVSCTKDYISFNLKLTHYYLDNDTCANHYPINLGDLCVFAENDAYHRCEILKIQSFK